MFEYRKSEDIGTFEKIASFSFAVRHSRHELLRKPFKKAPWSLQVIYSIPSK